MAFLSPLGAASGATDSALYDLVFRIFLKLLPCTSPKAYGCANGVQYIQHDLIFNLLLPHIFIFIFIFMAIQFGSGGHKGIQTLLGIGIYTFIIAMGWYGWIASLGIFWMGLVILFGIVALVAGKLSSPARLFGQYKRGFLRGTHGQRRREEQELRKIVHELKKMRDKSSNPDEKKKLSEEIVNYELKLKELERER